MNNFPLLNNTLGVMCFFSFFIRLKNNNQKIKALCRMWVANSPSASVGNIMLLESCIIMYITQYAYLPAYLKGIHNIYSIIIAYLIILIIYIYTGSS